MNLPLPSRAADPAIRVQDILFLRFARRDLPLTERYLRDFGMSVSHPGNGALYFRGVLPAHHIYVAEQAARDAFIGIAFRARSAADLQRLAHAPGASAVTASDEPGGGCKVTLHDPSGLRVEVYHDIQELPELPARPSLVHNTPRDKHRRNRPQPAVARPAQVFRLGHCVLQRQEFLRNAHWYIQTLGLIPSDVLLRPDNLEPVLAFLRCDRGAELADHHTVVIAAGPENVYEHSAYEVQDLDAVGMGAEWLQRQGWKYVWGVGRHILGSQLFSYHRDPTGAMVEHYADGDVFDADYPTRHHLMDTEGIYRWGPDIPRGFVDTGMNLARLRNILRGLRGSDEMNLQRLLALKKAMEAPSRPWNK